MGAHVDPEIPFLSFLGGMGARDFRQRASRLPNEPPRVRHRFRVVGESIRTGCAVRSPILRDDVDQLCQRRFGLVVVDLAGAGRDVTAAAEGEHELADVGARVAL